MTELKPRHTDWQRMMLIRFAERMVFGTYRYCKMISHKDEYRIIGGEVCLKFRGKWEPVKERNADRYDRSLEAFKQIALEGGREYYYPPTPTLILK